MGQLIETNNQEKSIILRNKPNELKRKRKAIKII